ncbi:MAG: hypothetical protein WCL32_00035 [Planctomycetota bacterium]
MRTLVETCLSLSGLLAVLGALACAFVTFATNDYRPIIAAGELLGAIGLCCFTALVLRRRKDAVFYLACGRLFGELTKTQ